MKTFIAVLAVLLALGCAVTAPVSAQSADSEKLVAQGEASPKSTSPEPTYLTADEIRALLVDGPPMVFGSSFVWLKTSDPSLIGTNPRLATMGLVRGTDIGTWSMQDEGGKAVLCLAWSKWKGGCRTVRVNSEGRYWYGTAPFTMQ